MHGRFDLAVVGRGFSGRMLLAQLAQSGAAKNKRIAWIGGGDALGAAYSTTRPEHLLNVPACAMSAWAEKPDDFLQWLADAGKALSGEDFVPRATYGAYLETITQKALAKLVEQGNRVEEFAARVAQLTRTKLGHWQLSLGSPDGVRVNANHTVLALGNALTPPAIAHPHYHASPWSAPFEEMKGKHVVLLGTGLTAVDCVSSLRGTGARITAISRSGAWPQPHAVACPSYTLRSAPPQGSAAQTMRWLRDEVAHAATHHVPWQAVLNAVRQHTQGWWQNLPPQAQQSFLSHGFSAWNHHRHRMPPAGAQAIEEALSSGQMRVQRGSINALEVAGKTLEVTLADGTRLSADIALECRGPRYSPRAYPLLAQMLENGNIRTTENGAGIAVDEGFYAAKNLQLLGTPLFGQLLETTAVPELRTQAAHAAKALAEELQKPSVRVK